MSGQNYVYIVWQIARDSYDNNKIVSTLPTKYQARYCVDRLPKGEVYRIQRWRHGDTKGHWCD